MKVVFLDVDGVLNDRAWLHHETIVPVPDGTVKVEHYIDNPIAPYLVARLNEIVRRTGAFVVVSSTWRLGMSLKELDALLDKGGFKHPGTILGKTGTIGGDRGHEIQAWLDLHGAVERFVILDDDSDMAHLTPFLVLTPGEGGLQPAHVEAACAILNGHEFRSGVNPCSECDNTGWAPCWCTMEAHAPWLDNGTCRYCPDRIGKIRCRYCSSPGSSLAQVHTVP